MDATYSHMFRWRLLGLGANTVLMALGYSRIEARKENFSESSRTVEC